MPTTPVFEIPYPGPGDPDNVPADIYALAAWLEDHLNASSGIYTPTLTGLVNVAATGPLPLMWSRVGDIVTVDGAITVQATAAGSIQLGISLPIASNLADASHLSGLSGAEVALVVTPGTIGAEAANDRGLLIYSAPDTTNRKVRIHFTYQVI